MVKSYNSGQVHLHGYACKLVFHDFACKHPSYHNNTNGFGLKDRMLSLTIIIGKGWCYLVLGFFKFLLVPDRWRLKFLTTKSATMARWQVWSRWYSWLMSHPQATKVQVRWKKKRSVVRRRSPLALLPLLPKISEGTSRFAKWKMRRSSSWHGDAGA